eukprot:4083585-Amphidinium_carterae.1
MQSDLLQTSPRRNCWSLEASDRLSVIRSTPVVSLIFRSRSGAASSFTSARPVPEKLVALDEQPTRRVLTVNASSRFGQLLEQSCDVSAYCACGDCLFFDRNLQQNKKAHPEETIINRTLNSYGLESCSLGGE